MAAIFGQFPANFRFSGALEVALPKEQEDSNYFIHETVASAVMEDLCQLDYAC